MFLGLLGYWLCCILPISYDSKPLQGCSVCIYLIIGLWYSLILLWGYAWVIGSYAGIQDRMWLEQPLSAHVQGIKHLQQNLCTCQLNKCRERRVHTVIAWHLRSLLANLELASLFVWYLGLGFGLVIFSMVYQVLCYIVAYHTRVLQHYNRLNAASGVLYSQVLHLGRTMILEAHYYSVKFRIECQGQLLGIYNGLTEHAGLISNAILVH